MLRGVEPFWPSCFVTVHRNEAGVMTVRRARDNWGLGLGLGLWGGVTEGEGQSLRGPPYYSHSLWLYTL